MNTTAHGLDGLRPEPPLQPTGRHPIQWTRASTRTLIGVLLAMSLLAAGGCVSPAYRHAPPDTPAAVPVQLPTANRTLAVVLETVVVYNGPGSWKQNAYWDEYQVTLTNPGTLPTTVVAVTLTDMLGLDGEPGSLPWTLENTSRRHLAVFSNQRRRVVVGATVAATGVALIVASFADSLFSPSSSSQALELGGKLLVMAPPVWFAGTAVRNRIARHGMEEEFHRRRLVLPLTLEPGESRHGSLFFPVTPGPQRLSILHRSGDATLTLTLDLAALAGLHVLRQPGVDGDTLRQSGTVSATP